MLKAPVGLKLEKIFIFLDEIQLIKILQLLHICFTAIIYILMMNFYKNFV